MSKRPHENNIPNEEPAQKRSKVDDDGSLVIPPISPRWSPPLRGQKSVLCIVLGEEADDTDFCDLTGVAADVDRAMEILVHCAKLEQAKNIQHPFAANMLAALLPDPYPWTYSDKPKTKIFDILFDRLAAIVRTSPDMTLTNIDSKSNVLDYFHTSAVSVFTSYY
jgi:hypothetical protein